MGIVFDKFHPIFFDRDATVYFRLSRLVRVKMRTLIFNITNQTKLSNINKITIGGLLLYPFLIVFVFITSRQQITKAYFQILDFSDNFWCKQQRE